jgi:predicted nuclease of restriction endonuclease-like (RecB) superfamily
VNTSLIDLYWQVGEIISHKIASAEWGDGVVNQLADHIAQTQPGLRGFTRPNLFRMRQFYETYKDDVKVSALLRQLPWTHNLTILSQSKRPEEREFYLRMAAQEKWTSRELERQFKNAAFERTVLSPAKVSPAVRLLHPGGISAFKDAYTLEFLGLHGDHSESDLHQGLLAKLKTFLGELGRDFCFVGSQFPVQVGGRDFALDLLFFRRSLNCLIAIEPHENPAIGVLLCASKDDEVVEYALSRTASPALIAQYETQLPDKALLQSKLHEFYLQNTTIAVA